MATKLILLERVDNLGNMGDTVNVRPGYARNFLLPQKKALRATKENVAYFEARRKHLEGENEKRRKEAEKLAKKLEGIKVPLIRQASEGGQLFGSVTARDIAEEISNASGEKVERQMVRINQNFKLLGLFPVDVALHPEVKIQVTVNIARSSEEAEIQAKTGKALIVEESQAAKTAQAESQAEDSLLDEEALKARREREAEEAAESAEETAESQAKSKARAEKKKTRKPKAEEAAEEAEESSDEE